MSAFLFLLVLVPVAKRQRGPALVLLASAVAELIFFALKVQYARYLLPCYPLLAVFAVEGVSSGLGLGAAVRGGLGLLIALQAPLILPLYFQIPGSKPTGISTSVPERIPYRLALGQAATDYLNDVVKPGDRVLSLDTDVFRYNLDVPMERPATSTTDLNKVLGAPPGPELAAELVRRGYRWVVTDAHGQETWPPMRSKRFLRTYGALRFVKEGLSVYELCPAGCGPLPVGENLLTNPGFEELDVRGKPDGWLIYGQPALIRSSAHSGAISVETRPDDGLRQRLSVHPGRRYVLRHFTLAAGPSPFARLQLNWLGADGRLLKADIDIIPARNSWLESQLNAVAPADSATVDVYVSTQSGAVLFDDFFFAEAPAPH